MLMAAQFRESAYAADVRLSASMYLLTVSLWIPNSLAIPRMDSPLRFACCIAFHLSL